MPLFVAEVAAAIPTPARMIIRTVATRLITVPQAHYKIAWKKLTNIKQNKTYDKNKNSKVFIYRNQKNNITNHGQTT